MNPKAAMELHKNPNFRARKGDRIEVQMFEPENENYSWQVESFGDCPIKQTKEEWSFLFKTSSNFIYGKLPEELILPGTSITVTKMFVKDNVGIRKITMQVDPKSNFKGQC